MIWTITIKTITTTFLLNTETTNQSLQLMDNRDGKIQQETMYKLELKRDSTSNHNRMFKLEFNHNNKLLNIMLLLNNNSSNNFNLRLNQFSNPTNQHPFMLSKLKHLPFMLSKLKHFQFMLSKLQFKPLSTPKQPLSTPNQLQLKLHLCMLNQPPSTPSQLPSMLNPHLSNIMSLNLNMFNQNLLSKLIKVSDPHMQMRMSELGIQELF